MSVDALAWWMGRWGRSLDLLGRSFWVGFGGMWKSWVWKVRVSFVGCEAIDLFGGAGDTFWDMVVKGKEG